MKMTKRIAAMAACAVMTVTSMVGMSASAIAYTADQALSTSYINNNAGISINSYSPTLLNSINGWEDSLYASAAFGKSISYTSN